MVDLVTGTNFPAVRVNSLLAAAMMKTRHLGKETGVPTQSHPYAASLTLSACNNSFFVMCALVPIVVSPPFICVNCVETFPYQLSQLASKPAVGVKLYQKCGVFQDRLSHVQYVS